MALNQRRYVPWKRQAAENNPELFPFHPHVFNLPRLPALNAQKVNTIGGYMAILSFIFRHGIWISIPAFVVSVTFLVKCIAGVIRTMKNAQLFSVPLVEKQDIEFSEPGRVVLCMEGPLLSRRFARLKYKLTGPQGAEAKSRPVLLRWKSSGLSTARMELRIYRIDKPGPHVFQINGLGEPKPSDWKHRIVFTRPHLRYSILYVIGIVITSSFIIGSVVLFFLRLLTDSGGA